MTGLDCYKYYLAIKTHFYSDKYDCFNNNAKIKASYASYLKRNDCGRFEYLATKFQSIPRYIQFAASNIMYGNVNFIYKDFNESNKNLVEYIRRRDSITKIFTEDISKLHSFDFSICFQAYTKNLIKLETLVILDSLENFSDNQNIFLEDTIRLIKKSKGFVKFNPRTIFKSYINHLKEINS